MKIKITQTVNIDADAWAAEFGVDKKDVRADVQSYFNHWLQEQVDRLDLAPVSVDPAEYRGADYYND